MLALTHTLRRWLQDTECFRILPLMRDICSILVYKTDLLRVHQLQEHNWFQELGFWHPQKNSKHQHKCFNGFTETFGKRRLPSLQSDTHFANGCHTATSTWVNRWIPIEPIHRIVYNRIPFRFALFLGA